MSLIDFHCDTISRMYEEQTHLGHNSYHIDLEKLRASDYLAQWFAVFIDQKEVQGSLMQRAMAMIEYFKAELASYPNEIGLATSYKEYAHLKSEKKIAAFLSLEEGQIIEGRLENIDKLCELGVRLMTLTWNYDNDLGFAHPQQKGLTAFGKEFLAYLNHLPMFADISHLSEEALKDIKEVYKKPIIASHSNARSVYAHTRNLTDEGIKTVADSGGIIGLNFYSVFLNGSSYSAISDMTRHIQRIYQIGGEDVLALGTDFDGIECDLEVCNAGKMGKLIAALNDTYPERLVDKLTYQNAERFLKENL